MKISHDISRVEAFSDGVFAFAATLMVVNIDQSGSLFTLENNWINFIAFGVSFFVLVALWWLHYNYFRRTDNVDNWTIVLNVILLFMILFFVFPLKSLIQTVFQEFKITQDILASLFIQYSVGMLLIFLCLSLMYLRASQRVDDPQERKQLMYFASHFSIFVFVAIISIVLAFLQIGIRFGTPGFVFMLLGPLCYLHSVRFIKKHGVV